MGIIHPTIPMEESIHAQPVVSWRGRLPHLFICGFHHFFTLRVYNSIPEKELPRLKQLAEALRNLEPQSSQFRNLQRKQFAIMESALHQGEGFAPFMHSGIIESMHAHLRLLSEEVMPVMKWVIMPNHLHWISGSLDEGIIKTLRVRLSAWKGTTARQLNRTIRRKGSFWQREWYDHWIRDSSKVSPVTRYITENPSKAGISGFVGKTPRIGPQP